MKQITFTCFLDVLPKSAGFVVRDGKLKLKGLLNSEIKVTITDCSLALTGTKEQIDEAVHNLGLAIKVQKQFSNGIVMLMPGTYIYLFGIDSRSIGGIKRYKFIENENVAASLHVPDEYLEI